MSLAPSTDIVMEVARAADPTRAAAVVEKLNALGRGDAASPQGFAAALNDAAGATSAGVAAPAAMPPSRAKKAETQLESVMLSEFIGEMLPKDTPSAYGQGYAGDMWRSMLAERVADQIAASGRLGIASRLFAGHPLSSSARLFSADRASSPTQAQTVQASANALSSAGGAEIEEGAFLFSRAAPL